MIAAAAAWIASVLGTLFVSVVSYLAMYVTKRIALLVAALAALTLLTTGFLAAIHGAVAAFTYAMPSTFSIGMVVPAEAPVMLSVYLASKVAAWVYWWNVRIVQLRLF